MSSRTWTCLIRGSLNSTGSSAVRMLISGELIEATAAYRVVDFPLPVGPVTRIIPCGARMARWTRSRSSASNPSWARSSTTRDLSRMRRTMLSPKIVGRDDTRRSISRSASVAVIRPSWGRRRSAMSSCAMIFTRERMAASMGLGGAIMSWSTPSIRYRTWKASSPGSRWMSDARLAIASARTRLTRRTTGASAPSASSSEMSTFLRARSANSIASAGAWGSLLSRASIRPR